MEFGHKTGFLQQNESTLVSHTRDAMDLDCVLLLVAAGNHNVGIVLLLQALNFRAT